MAILVNFGLVIMAPIFSVGIPSLNISQLHQPGRWWMFPALAHSFGFRHPGGCFELQHFCKHLCVELSILKNAFTRFKVLQAPSPTTANCCHQRQYNTMHLTPELFLALGGNVAAWLIPLLGIVFTFINIALTSLFWALLSS